MFTNQMRIQSTLDDQVQSELSSNSLQHLQLAVDGSASGILHQICKLKRKSISNLSGPLRRMGWQKCSILPLGQDMQQFLEERWAS